MRVVSDAIAASDHRVVGQLPGETDAGSKELLAPADTVVLRDAASPADQGLIGCGVVGFDAQAGRAPAVGIKLPSQAKGEGQLGCGAPAVADVESILVLQAVHLDVLAALS